ncbi:MAG: hypothetical protein PHU43_09715, partial [Candidatus Bipolaricaulis sp.]|nr:hypothetical protein [Candidatus Bipolaricaulis sp.]
QQIMDPLWLNKDRHAPQPTTESGHPAEFLDGDGAIMCFDPEGQTWEAPGQPDWFPNRAWGIERLSINWGDGTSTPNVAFQDAADTVAQHEYSFTGGVKSWTITVTAYDFLGAHDSFERTITFNVGG